MSIEITSWLRAFFALQTSAMESRGFIEIETDGDVARWPRTIGTDVIAIAAVFDRYVRAQPLRFGGHGLARRWRACIDDLEQLALVAPRAEYLENRSFWRTLPAVCVYLHAQGARLPPAHVWDGLLAQLAELAELRNVGPRGDGPFKHFDAKTFTDLYIAQLKYLIELRGSDHLDPGPGMTGANQVIPRSTNGDVVALADYWSKQLADAKNVSGTAGVEKRWKEALVDVDAIARKGDASAAYPKNNGFWRALSNTAIHVSAADEAPSKSDIMLDALKESVKHLPENIAGGVKAVASEVADLTSSVAHSVGNIAHEAGKGLFSGFGTPLLIGAGVIGGVYLLSRRNKHDSAEA